MPTFAGELINAAVGVASLDDTALRGSYRVVSDVAARNAIVGSDFDKTGMRVFVQSTDELWQRTAAGWDILSGAAIDSSVNPDQIERIYISSTGDDSDNDGSVGSPFATPDRAAKKIGNGSQGFFFVIPLDDGPFIAPGPVLCEPKVGAETVICFSGRLDVQDAIIPTSPPVSSPVAGKSTQHDATTSGYTVPIGRGTHWFADGFFPVEEQNIVYPGITCLSLDGAVSPSMRFISPFGGLFGVTGYDIPVRPISAVYETAGQSTFLGGRSEAIKIKFVGLKFSDSSGALVRTDPRADFISCDCSGLATSTLVHSGTSFIANGILSQLDFPRETSGFSAGGILTGFFPHVAGYLTQATMTAGGILSQKISVQRPAARISMGDIDFEGSSTYNVRVFEGNHQFVVFGDQTTSGAVVHHFYTESDSSAGVDMTSGGTVTGTVTNGWTLQGASHARGLAVGCAGLIATGTDVVVGNAGSFAYGALPQNDFTAVTGVGTVVVS